jgi:predicted kinase
MLALCPPASHAPLVLVFAGLPGAGKSTLARNLASATRWPILDRDQIRADLTPGDASDAAREAADRLLLRRVGSGVRAAMNLIVDGKTFARAGDRARLQEEIDDAGGEYQWCWLDLPAEVAIDRIENDPAHPAPDRDAALVHAVAARFEPLADDAWQLDARLPPGELTQMLLLRLAARLNAILIDDRE